MIDIFSVKTGDYVTIRALVEYAAGDEAKPSLGVRSTGGTLNFIYEGDITSHEPAFKVGDRIVSSEGPGEVLKIVDGGDAAVFYDSGVLRWCSTKRLSRAPAAGPSLDTLANKAAVGLLAAE